MQHGGTACQYIHLRTDCGDVKLSHLSTFLDCTLILITVPLHLLSQYAISLMASESEERKHASAERVHICVVRVPFVIRGKCGAEAGERTDKWHQKKQSKQQKQISRHDLVLNLSGLDSGYCLLELYINTRTSKR